MLYSRLAMKSPRLRYRPIEEADLDQFFALVIDDHIKRYLFDGETMPRQWCVDAVATNRRMFDESGLGLWLIYEAEGSEPIGFCGYWVFEELGPEKQLLYALTEPHTGRGYATEAGAALVEVGRAAGLEDIVTAVDEPNIASLRVLEKLGFERTGEAPGKFGRNILLVLRG